MPIRKSVFLIIILSVIIVLNGWSPVAAQARAAIVVVKSRNLDAYNSVAGSFKKLVMSRRPDVEVQEFNFEDEGDKEINDEIAAIKPALTLALGTPATKAAYKSGTTVVYTMILEPGKSNIHPPGVALDIPFELKVRELKRILPDLKKLGTIYSSSYRATYDDIRKDCERFGIQLIGKQVDSQKDFPAALDELFKEVDCFLMVADPSLYLPKTTEYLLVQGLQQKVPVIGLSSSYTKAGALISFDCDYEDLGRQTAELVIRILNNDQQALGEEEIPRKARFSLNLLAAQKMGIAIPPAVVQEASEVFGK